MNLKIITLSNYKEKILHCKQQEYKVYSKLLKLTNKLYESKYFKLSSRLIILHIPMHDMSQVLHNYQSKFNYYFKIFLTLRD